MRIRATAVVVKDEKILMIHRYNHGEEYWVLPGGGVEKNEDIEKAVWRELEEEASIKAELKDKLLEFTDSKGDGHFLFKCEYLSGEPKLQEDSVEATSKDKEQSYNPEWVDINKLSELTIYPIEEQRFLIKNFSKRS